MTANEFRIGNYVRTKIGNIIKIDCVRKDFVDVFFNDKSFQPYSYNLLKPIELTEEILLKIKDHEKRPTSVIFDRFRLVYQPTYKFWYLFDYELKTYLTKVEFLHEYQNVIYALNGIELEIIL